MGDYLGTREELGDWVSPKVESWAHRLRTIAKISKRYPQLAYAGLYVSLQLEWQYLQRTVPGVGYIMVPIEDFLREAFSTALFGREEVSADLRKILGHSVKRGGLGIPYPRMSVDLAYNTSKAASEILVSSLLGYTNLNYVTHKGCVRRAITDGQK